MNATRRAVVAPFLLLLLAACGGATGGTVGTPAVATPVASAPTASVTSTVPAPTLVATATAPALPTPAPSTTSTPPAATAEPAATLPVETELVGAVRPELPGKLAFVRGGDTWVYHPRTGELRMLVQGTTAARWSADGTSLAFTRGDGVYLADGDGGGERRIHDEPAAQAPVWSPDGSKIAWTTGTAADAPGRRAVWVYDRTANTARKVAQGANPAWAPDSKRIAYVTLPADDNPPRRTQLRLVSWEGKNDWAVVKDMPNGTPPIGIPDGKVAPADLEHVMDDPFWDKDGRSIYVASFVSYQVLTDFFIWERADGWNGGSTFLGELPGSTATQSPDRGAVLFSASSARGDTWFEAHALGGNDKRWQWATTPNGALSGPPAWAPDAQAVAYYHCELDTPERCDLRVRTPTGEDTLTADVFGGTPPDLSQPVSLDWSPDA